ncbi:MAG: DUF6516 family protein [Thermoplasmatota archaeon]
MLDESDVVKDYEILDFQLGENFYFLKMRITLVDESELYAREYVSEEKYLYSYHWQSRNGETRVRWDNAPHYPEIENFPHHKHVTGKRSPEPSTEMTVADVLKSIQEKLERHTNRDEISS